MRYAIFSDIHANLEALEAVLAKIDEIAQEQPIDQIWFLGDLVGYGPNPNECIVALRARTKVIIAGNHDWAAVGKMDLEEFSAAARISAEWTATELTEEHQTFLSELPERLNIGDSTLVHGSPYGPLWEYLTSEVLAERSFNYFSSRYCFVGHTHIPVIFQQPVPADYDEVDASAPTLPLEGTEESNGIEDSTDEYFDEEDDDEETVKIAAIRSVKPAESTHVDPGISEDGSKEEPKTVIETVVVTSEKLKATTEANDGTMNENGTDHGEKTAENIVTHGVAASSEAEALGGPKEELPDNTGSIEGTNSASVIQGVEQPSNSEVEELLVLLGLSQSMMQVTNELVVPPEGHWQAPNDHRFIVNPGGVGQPRDGDPRAAFMIYDTEGGIEFYRVSYEFEKTQEKIIKAGLPQYLALRLAYGR